MSPRERILTAMSHQMPDRVPLHYWGRIDVDRTLRKYLHAKNWQDVARRLGFYGTAPVGVGIRFPKWEARTDKVAKKGDFPGAGTPYVWLDDCTFENEWGTVHRIGSGGRYLEYVRGPLQNAEDPDEYDYPTPDRIVDEPDLPKRIADLKAQGLFVRGGVENLYKTTWQLRGMEQTLMDYLINRDFKEKLYDKICPLQEEICRRLVSAGIDMFEIGGDISMHDRIIMGAQTWREVDKPRIARLIAVAKSINPDVHIFIHSDGNLIELMDDLIEIGFDVINPIQPECMEPAMVKRRWGDKITLHGCGSLQKVLPFGTVDDVRKHVTYLIENCGRNGGLVLGPSNNLQPDVPMENIVAFYDTALQYDLSKLR